MQPDQKLVKWETRSEKLHAECIVFDVYVRRCYHPVRKVESDFAVISSPTWIQAIALNPDGHLIMVNQYRFGRDTFSWEMPGGLLEKDEAIIDGAARELVEETGYTSKRAKILGSCSPNPAIQNNLTHFVLFEDCRLTGSQKWDTHEEIETGVFTVDEALQMVSDGRIHNSITFNALFLLQRELNYNPTYHAS